MNSASGSCADTALMNIHDAFLALNAFNREWKLDMHQTFSRITIRMLTFGVHVTGRNAYSSELHRRKHYDRIFDAVRQENAKPISGLETETLQCCRTADDVAMHFAVRERAAGIPIDLCTGNRERMRRRNYSISKCHVYQTRCIRKV